MIACFVAAVFGGLLFALPTAGIFAAIIYFMPQPKKKKKSGGPRTQSFGPPRPPSQPYEI